MKKILSLIVTSLLLSTAAIALHEDSQDERIKKELSGDLITVQATIVSIDSASEMITLKIDNADQKFTLPSNTMVKGKSSLADFKAGDRVRITYRAKKGVKKIESLTALK